MKKLMCVLLVTLVPYLSVMTTAVAAESNNDSVVIKSEERGVFKGFLYRFWGKLRAISPRTASKSRRSVATAGVRGAETTNSIISPYWKDDNTDDPEYIKELTEYSKAQQMAEDGDLPGAVAALNSFIDNHATSDFKPNAQFALGISYGGLGKNNEGVNVLKNFVNDNPKHPLVGDAQQLITELR